MEIRPISCKISDAALLGSNQAKKKIESITYNSLSQSTILSLNRNEPSPSCLIWCKFFLNVIFFPFYLIYRLCKSLICSCFKDSRENAAYWLRLYKEDPKRMRKELFEWILYDPKSAASTVFALIGLGEKESEDHQFQAIIHASILEEQEIWAESHENSSSVLQEFWKNLILISH